MFLGPGRSAVGLERIGVGVDTEDQHAIGPLVPTGREIVADVPGRVNPCWIFAPIARIASQDESMRLRVAVGNVDANERRGHSGESFQSHGAEGVFIGVFQCWTRYVEPRPATARERLAVDLRSDLDAPQGRRRSEGEG